VGKHEFIPPLAIFFPTIPYTVCEGGAIKAWLRGEKYTVGQGGKDIIRYIFPQLDFYFSVTIKIIFGLGEKYDIFSQVAHNFVKQCSLNNFVTFLFFFSVFSFFLSFFVGSPGTYVVFITFPLGLRAIFRGGGGEG
jgi:hypothetical protein